MQNWNKLYPIDLEKKTLIVHMSGIAEWCMLLSINQRNICMRIMRCFFMHYTPHLMSMCVDRYYVCFCGILIWMHSFCIWSVHMNINCLGPRNVINIIFYKFNSLKCYFLQQHFFIIFILFRQFHLCL